MVTEHSKLQHLSAEAKAARFRARDAVRAKMVRGTITREQMGAEFSHIDLELGVPKAEKHQFQFGEKFGRLTVVGFDKNRHGQEVLICACSCGGETVTARRELLAVESPSCGCIKAQTDFPVGSGELALRVLIGHYRASAKQRNLPFELPKDVIRHLLLQPCCYCGEPPSRRHVYTLPSGRQDSAVVSGLDRVKNDVGYTLLNSVPCCSKCNYAKGEMGLSEFIAWALRFVGGDHPTVQRSEELEAASSAYSVYKSRAKRKKLNFELSFAEFLALIKSSCGYCSAKPYRVWRSDGNEFTCNGVDRRDNESGYAASNVIACCPQCNYAKRSMAEQEFRGWVANLASNLKRKLTSGDFISHQ